MFCHLHVHTEYSLLDGMSRITELIANAKEMGMKSIAITDHGVMYGALKFYLEAQKAGLKPIIGCEVYVARGSRFDKETNGFANKPYHLTLLAKNKTGYQNLLALVTEAHLNGFYYKPRVDKELLEKHNKGLVALSGCMGGEIPQMILNGRIEDAKTAAIWHKETFPEFHIEIQRHPIADLERVNEQLIPLARELDIPLVATNDSHYVNKEDAPSHDILLCVGTNSTIHEEKRMKMDGDFYYLKSPEEMAKQYTDIPDAIENTAKIASLCNLKLDFDRVHLPEIDIPEGKTPFDYLKDLCYAGLKERYPEITPEIKERLEYELDVIKKTDFPNYFLVVWDIAKFVRENNIFFGVRGSAAASIVLHCLGITAIEPLSNKLVFERFLNIERKEMPDIDMDFEDSRREEVIKYVSDKYGQDHVAQIITFGTLGAKAAIRDVGRALGMPYGDVDRVAKLVPFAPGMTLDRALEENKEFKDIYTQEAVVKNLVDAARRVEGNSRHASTHAAGVLISKEPLTKNVPLQRPSRGNGDSALMTQYDMGDIAKIGLLKMDFLGLINLSILEKATSLIYENHGKKLDLTQIPMDDEKTFKLLSDAETTGVFQLESAGMKRYIKELKPSVFTDIAAMVALYRPGPMEQIPTFIKAKHGIEPIKYPHPDLADILEETYGVIVYQEQVLFIAQKFAGYTLGQADILRKAMGKKIADVMTQQEKGFIEGAAKKGFSEKLAKQIFELIKPFAGYAFNKAHAVSYALIAYQTAYLKANYPVEYITATLKAHAEQTEKVATAIGECRRLDIKVLPPCINHSFANFSIENNKETGVRGIRYGLGAIKNVGWGAVEPIIKEREENGKYSSIEDLCARADISSANKRVFESLIKAGALDELGGRPVLLANIERILSLAARQRQLKESGQTTMFDLWGESAPMPTPSLEMEQSETEIDNKEKLTWEKELMGVYLSEHPFKPYAKRAEVEGVTSCSMIEENMDGQSISVAGVVISTRQLFTKDGNTFISAVIEDLEGSIEVMVWPRTYAETKDFWSEGNVLLIDGKVRVRGDRVQVSCDKTSNYDSTVPLIPKETFAEAPVNVKPKTDKPAEEHKILNQDSTSTAPVGAYRVIMELKQTKDKDADIRLLQCVLGTIREYPGNDEIILRIENGSKIYSLKLPEGAYFNEALHYEIKNLIGEKAIIKEKL